MSEVNKNRIVDFAKQDSVTVQLPSQKYKGQRFLRGPMRQIYNMYEESEDFHVLGKMSKSTVYRACRAVAKPEGKIPVEECKCEEC